MTEIESVCLCSKERERERESVCERVCVIEKKVLFKSRTQRKSFVVHHTSLGEGEYSIE